MKKCPYCGEELPEEAAFCPHCARSINDRETPKPPRPLPRRALKLGAALLAVLVLALTFWYVNRPQELEGCGQLEYTDDEGTYQLAFGFPSNHFLGMEEQTLAEEEGGDFRFPLRVYVNHVESGANAAPVFLKKVESCTAQVVQLGEKEAPVSCGQPEQMDFDPEAAWISLVDFVGCDGEAEVVFHITMKNGDKMELKHSLHLQATHTAEYHWEEVPMDTPELLQALLDRVGEENEKQDTVNIYLPPIAYEQGVEVRGRSVNLIGSVGEDGQRTAFLDTLRYNSEPGGILATVSNIDFRGNGGGVGLSASSTMMVQDCSFEGWKTGLLGYGCAWVNVRGSAFGGNGVGFHFNSEGTSVTHTMYDGNKFLDNGIGVLLERVPTDTSISFDDTLFQGNGTDIDNRCSQAIDISKAIIK